MPLGGYDPGANARSVVVMASVQGGSDRLAALSSTGLP